MTIAEAKELLDNLIGMISDNQESDYDTALKMAIEALEQTECEDCISKERLKECFHKNVVGSKVFDELIDMQPSVRPKEKVGHWIVEAGDRETGYGGCTMCSECSGEGDTEMDYCPHCGAKMVELKESEDKE